MGVPYAEVIGDPVAHSKSPLIHKFWLEKLRLEGDYRALRISSEELSNYLTSRRADPDWRGCNVTIPHKVAISSLLDEQIESATVACAVNTVVKTEGRLIGANTDLRGFAEPFRDSFQERGTTFLIGSGGAARAVFVALAGLGFEIAFVASRNPDNATAMLKSLGISREGVSIPERIPAVDLVVNASAMGMQGMSDLQLDLSQLPPTAIVYDIVYDPLETRLLAMARKHGLRTIDGLSMLIGQAALAFVHFFQADPPREHDGELRRLLIQ